MYHGTLEGSWLETWKHKMTLLRKYALFLEYFWRNITSLENSFRSVWIKLCKNKFLEKDSLQETFMNIKVTYENLKIYFKREGGM
jgi:hypothetical protein